MPNVIINTICNLRCPYCFADDCKENNVNQNMTVEDFKKVLDFISRTDGYVGILGGEPTIHPNFDGIMSAVISDDRINACTVFTNGIAIDDHLGMFASRKVGTLVNFNDQSIVNTPGNFERMMDNMELLFDLKKNQQATGLEQDNSDIGINLGLNVYKQDQDFSDIIHALHKFGRHNLRMSTVVPNNQDKRGMNPIEYFKSMKPTLMKLFDQLLEIECVPNSDCNYIPLCVFTDDELDKLNRSFIPIAQKYKRDFNITSDRFCHMGPIDIYPDMTVARCFGFSEYDRQNISDYKDIEGIRNYFLKTIENTSFYIPASEECKTCYAHKTMKCSGGCLSYKGSKIDGIRKSVGV